MDDTVASSRPRTLETRVQKKTPAERMGWERTANASTPGQPQPPCRSLVHTTTHYAQALYDPLSTITRCQTPRPLQAIAQRNLGISVRPSTYPSNVTTTPPRLRSAVPRR